MIRNLVIIVLLATVVALPFVFQRDEETAGWKAGDPVLVIVSPHNEAIRYEFGQAFSRWHEERFGRPVKVDWRVIGGTTEIMRYLSAEYAASFRAWWTTQGHAWPEGGADMILDSRFDPSRVPEGLEEDVSARQRWERKKEMHRLFRETDTAEAFMIGIDLLFGGGTYDHGKAAAQGLSVAPWPADDPPPDTITDLAGKEMLPAAVSGETWRTDTFFGTALSTFGICYNADRLLDLGVREPPRGWEDLTAPEYFRQLGVADPTKSGSIAKAFEMMIHEQCHRAVARAGFSSQQTDAYEAAIRAARLAPGELPQDVPGAYQAAVEQGWLNGLRLVQRIGANARYFTDGAGRVPTDVGMGNAAVGVAIDFYGRYQAEMSRGPDGEARMFHVTPSGGSSVGADPISLLRGSEHRQLAVRFMSFVLGEQGQRVWNYAPGTPGGPRRFALRRLPIRRDFYPSDDPAVQAAHERHLVHAVDALGDPAVDPYKLARSFIYRSRWTGRHFNLHRDLVKAMCMDAGQELQAAWQAILENGGPQAQPQAVRALGRMPDRPEPLTWSSAVSIGKRHDRMDLMREWTLFFRASYREARALVRTNRPGQPAAGRRVDT